MIFILHDPIYQQDVLVAIGCPHVPGSNAVEDRIVRAVVRTGYTISDPKEMAELLVLGVANGRTVMDPDSGAVVIRLRRLRPNNPKDVGYLVHEAVHAATMLFGRIGFPLKPETDEPLAYYVQFIVRTVLEKVRKR